MSNLSGYTGRPPGIGCDYQDHFNDDCEVAKMTKEMTDMTCEDWERFNNDEDDEGGTELRENFSRPSGASTSGIARANI